MDEKIKICRCDRADQCALRAALYWNNIRIKIKVYISLLCLPAAAGEAVVCSKTLQQHADMLRAVQPPNTGAFFNEVDPIVFKARRPFREC